MPQTELLMKNAASLPAAYLKELIDFAIFLNRKSSSMTINRSEQKKPNNGDDEWPDYWEEAAKAKPGSVKFRMFTPEEFIEARSHV
jgi:hypothetical protein